MHLSHDPLSIIVCFAMFVASGAAATFYSVFRIKRKNEQNINEPVSAK